MTRKIAVLPGDGIGPEVVAEAVKVLERLRRDFGLKIEMETAPVGGTAYDLHKHPLPEATLKLARNADAVLLGAVGGVKWDTLPRELRPEKALLSLNAPIERITGFDIPMPLAKLESYYLPDAKRVIIGVKKVLQW